MKMKCLVQGYKDSFTDKEVNSSDVVIAPLEHKGVKSFMIIRNKVGDRMQIIKPSQLGKKLFEMYLEK